MTEAMRLNEFTSRLETADAREESSFRPWCLRLANGELEQLRARGLHIIDTIERQLEDLAAVRIPQSQKSAERQGLVAEALAQQEAFGNWMYLPWAKRLAHILDREDYFDVITNRNQNKITREEQLRLRTKRIGAVGLSVGGEAAVTVAQEHLCGHIVLADFDALDLSNLNRLNAGFDEIGLNKAVLVARRIARIDPYLEVTVFQKGVSDDNLGEFLKDLDLMIEECDALGIKYRIREEARRRDLNLLYAADERGYLSVEPYASEPDSQLFHGRISSQQPSRDSFERPLDFLKALSEWLGGWENLSKRSRDSLPRIGDTLCGYPQLASEPRYAAGQIGHVARRLLLGEAVPPFLGNLDLDELVPSETR